MKNIGDATHPLHFLDRERGETRELGQRVRDAYEQLHLRSPADQIKISLDNIPGEYADQIANKSIRLVAEDGKIINYREHIHARGELLHSYSLDEHTAIGDPHDVIVRLSKGRILPLSDRAEELEQLYLLDDSLKEADIVDYVASVMATRAAIVNIHQAYHANIKPDNPLDDRLITIEHALTGGADDPATYTTLTTARTSILDGVVGVQKDSLIINSHGSVSTRTVHEDLSGREYPIEMQDPSRFIDEMSAALNDILNAKLGTDTAITHRDF